MINMRKTKINTDPNSHISVHTREINSLNMGKIGIIIRGKITHEYVL